jgi:hypothetical protein
MAVEKINRSLHPPETSAMIRNVLTALIPVAVIAAMVSPASAQWADLKGKFVYDGPVPTAPKLTITKDVEVCGVHNLVDEELLVGADGGLANVVIYVSTKSVKTHPDYEKTAGDKVIFDNKNCRFEPHVLAMRLSQTIVLKNSDSIGHNSNVQPPGDQGINPLLPPGGAAENKFNLAQRLMVPISCNIHGWMKGYVVIRDNPYFAVTGKDGTFEIKNLPVGEELEFQVLHEKAGYLVAKSDWLRGRFKMKIKDGGSDLGTVKVSPKLLSK